MNIQKNKINAELLTVTENNDIELLTPYEIMNSELKHWVISFNPNQQTPELKLVESIEEFVTCDNDIYSMKSNKFKGDIHLEDTRTSFLVHDMKTKKYIGSNIKSFNDAHRLYIPRYFDIKNLINFENEKLNKIEVGFLIGHWLLSKGLKVDDFAIFNQEYILHEIDEKIWNLFDVSYIQSAKNGRMSKLHLSGGNDNLFKPFINENNIKHLPLNVLGMDKFLNGMMYGLLQNSFLMPDERNDDIYYCKCYCSKDIGNRFAYLMNMKFNIKIIIKCDVTEGTDYRTGKPTTIKRYYMSYRLNELIRSFIQQGVSFVSMPILDDIIKCQLENPNNPNIIFNPIIHYGSFCEMVSSKFVTFEKVETNMKMYSLQGDMLNNVMTSNGVFVKC